MGDVLKITVTNNSQFALTMYASADWTRNWSGHLDRTTLRPGEAVSVHAEKDDLFVGGGVFGHAQIRVTFLLTDEVVVQTGPVTDTYPRIPVAKVVYDDATWAAWTGGGYALSMAPPYTQLRMDFTMANDTSTVTLS